VKVGVESSRIGVSIGIFRHLLSATKPPHVSFNWIGILWFQSYSVPHELHFIPRNHKPRIDKYTAQRHHVLLSIASTKTLRFTNIRSWRILASWNRAPAFHDSAPDITTVFRTQLSRILHHHSVSEAQS
jgi:hypothetical protein